MIFLFKRFMKIVLIISEFSPLALLWLAKAMSIDWIIRQWAFRRLPAVGASIGLKHRRSDLIREFGTLEGVMAGHRITVEPFSSMNPIIRVEFVHRYDKLELSLRKPYMVLPSETVDFSTTNWKFNTIYRTKRAGKKMAEAVRSSRELQDQLVAFYEKWIFQLDTLLVGGNDIFCRLKYGFNVTPHIPPWALPRLVTELAAIAARIETELTAHRTK